MSAMPWRGTLIFAGGVAAVAATSLARFAGADVVAPQAAAAPTVGAAAGVTASGGVAGAGSSSTAPATGGSTDPGSTAGTTSPSPAAGGTVTIVGSTVQTRYGPLQLSVTFAGSDITDVQALQYPSWHGESVQINAYAIPVLTQEAVAADSATIDAVSGATVTSAAYKKSLQAAIDQHG